MTYEAAYIMLDCAIFNTSTVFSKESGNVSVTVDGCGDMSPPEGAWMTRDGDVIEIGCHSGSKTWTLRCDANKWIGVLGYCGHHRVEETPPHKNDVSKGQSAAVWRISPSKSQTCNDD